MPGRDWEKSENVGFDDDLKFEDKQEEDNLNRALVEHFRKTTVRDFEGRYVLRLPFKSNIRALGDNENLSRSRLHSFIEKLKKDPTKLKAVDDEIKGYLAAGFAEEAQPKQVGQLAHYLPIQAVFKAKPDTPSGLKTRVVKDASARRSNEAGLNDVLHCGMNLLPEISKVLFKFRRYKFVFTADIEKAFLQFRIADSDKTFLRFLWPLDISNNGSAKIKEFWATRLDFGLICSPFLHCQGIRFHLESAMEKYPRDTSFIEEIRDTFYMDEVIGGGDSICEAKHRIRLLSNIFTEAHFPLDKLSTNSPELERTIRQASPLENLSITSGQADAKILGVPWNQVSDSLSAPISKAIKELTTGTPTKRKLLRALAQVFDPLGIISPIVISSKIIFQDLWKEKIGWDDPLQGDYLNRFYAFEELLSQARQLSIARQLNLAGQVPNKKELFAFCYASLHAYGMVAYLKTHRPANTPEISLLLAKSKVAPIKATTIHRLELLGALLAARMTKKILEWIDFRIDAVHMFCDNSAVLGWITSNPDKWKPFVANRIRKIHGLTIDAKWHYWLSLDDADLEAHLKLERAPLGRAPLDSHSETQYEQKKSVTSLLVAHSKSMKDDPKIFFEDSFSCWLKAIRFWGFMLRLKAKAQLAKSRVRSRTKCSARPKTELNLIDPDEMNTARLELIKLIQKSYFPEEVDSNCERVGPKSLLFQYNPFIDEEGILRSKTRLQRSPDFSEAQKNPIILPSNCNFSKLIIRYIHERKCLHFGGVSATLHILREDFLILHTRKLSRQVISACMICKIFRCQAASLPTAQSPSFRLETTPPFFYTGCDFAGPIKYKKDSGEKAKGYILLFTCAVTRAVNLQLTADMSTVEVLGALQKFDNRYPSVYTITSDNGLSFQRAAKELKTLYSHIVNGDIKKWLADSFLKWEFIIPHAPWFGGFYERQVQSVKRPLRKVLGSAVPHFRDLEVILSNIEAMINRRPITAIAAETDQIEALSPADLLYGYKSKTFFPQHVLKPPRPIEADKIIFSRRWVHQQKIPNSFWKRFHNEYLSYLRSAHNRKPLSARPLKVGDICLLEDSNSNRALWPLCRVIALKGNAKPEEARSCTIKTATGQVFDRPMKKLYPIEATESH
ncbi:uncharacterized protein LOC100898489 [Galendromus occidentalis]|uniref:Uncharacterized protein LOC100898489 n=1 Tax=Galendromus occidentalis TaxID=34638 RepID=A0AAJ6VVQ6_9ACAR|nr:uncharacterized protein LOC100898489 [Galendromus occidentalis]